MTYRDLFAGLFAFGTISFIFFLLFYGLTSLCYQKMFKAYGYPHPGYAWIPFYRLYILADLTCHGNFRVGDFSIEKKYFLWWWLISYVLAFVPMIGGFLSLIINVICLGFCYNNGIKKVDQTFDASILAYISAIFPIFLWFLVLPKKVR